MRILGLFPKVLLALALFFFTQTSPAKSWKDWAKYVGPAESKRPNSIRQLKKIKNLNQILLSEILGPNQGYALDVIAALNRSELIPNLLDLVKKDSSGFVSLTINSLMTPENKDKIIEKYKELLREEFEKLSPATIVAFMEPIGRVGSSIDKKVLAKISKHRFPEVRIESLQYARTQKIKYSNSKYLSLFGQFKKEKSYQILRMIHSFRQELLALPAIEEKVFEMIPKIKLKKPRFRIEGKDFRVVFGYKDARPGRFVGDRHERLAFIQELLGKCPGKTESLCGFRRHARDSDLFLKKLDNSNAEMPLKIHLRVSSSSVMTDDEANRKNPLQRMKSEETLQDFLAGLEDADVVFYNGHSRFGGGPDFTPPVLNTAGRVDSSFYKRDPLGLNRSLKALEERNLDILKEPLDVFGFFSCQSSKHFKKSLKKARVGRVISSPKLLHYSDALILSQDELGSILSNL